MVVSNRDTFESESVLKTLVILRRFSFVYLKQKQHFSAMVGYSNPAAAHVPCLQYARTYSHGYHVKLHNKFCSRSKFSSYMYQTHLLAQIKWRAEVGLGTRLGVAQTKSRSAIFVAFLVTSVTARMGLATRDYHLI